MIEYLDHLLGKSQGQVPTLMPRPVSIYEPAPEPADHSLDEPGLEPGQSPDNTVLFPPRLRHELSSKPDQASLPPDPKAGVHRRLDELQAWLGRLSAHADANLPESAASRPPARLHQTSPDVSLPVASTPSIDSPGPSFPPERSHRDSISPPREGHAAQPETLVREVIVRPAPPPETPPIQEALVRPTFPMPSMQETPNIRKPPAPPSEDTQETHSVTWVTPRLPESSRLALRSHPAHQAQQPPPQQVVKVTIGRLEVRAVRHPTSPPASASRSTGPLIMGLDEYLRQRNGGSGA